MEEENNNNKQYSRFTLPWQDVTWSVTVFVVGKKSIIQNGRPVTFFPRPRFPPGFLEKKNYCDFSWFSSRWGTYAPIFNGPVVRIRPAIITVVQRYVPRYSFFLIYKLFTHIHVHLYLIGTRIKNLVKIFEQIMTYRSLKYTREY